MFSKLAQNSTKKLIEKNVILKTEQELYEYGLFMIYSYLFFLAMTILIGFLVNMPCESILFFLVFGIVRNYSGGIHANSESKCTLITMLLISSGILVIKLINCFDTYFIAIIIMIISTISLIAISPIDNPNKKLNKQEKKKYHKKTVLLTLFLMLVFTLLFISNLNCLAYSISVGNMLASLLLILGKIKYLKGDLKT